MVYVIQVLLTACEQDRTELALISQIYFWNETLHVSESSSVHHQEFFTERTAMVCVIHSASTKFQDWLCRANTTRAIRRSPTETRRSKSRQVRQCKSVWTITRGLCRKLNNKSVISFTQILFIMQVLKLSRRTVYDIYHCCVYSEKLLMMDRGTVRNMYSFIPKIN